MFMWVAIIALIFTGSAWVLALAFRHDFYHETDLTLVRAYLVLRACFWIGLVVMLIFLIMAVKYD